jgi:hypothetical protein
MVRGSRPARSERCPRIEWSLAVKNEVHIQRVRYVNLPLNNPGWPRADR